jgi:hypothetical protein
MKTKNPAILLFCLCVALAFSLSPAHAQSTYSIKGIVADTTSHTKLVNATITVMNSKDSILYKFTRTKADGSFSITNMAPGTFLLLVTYHDYADYVQPFTLDAVNPARNFGPVNLILKAKLLEEVIVNGTAPITIKGDTTIFNASKYKIQPNDRVEDLLKQMPGIQVDQNGRITAQGVQVQKVLVEGEEFFGSDPVLVTRNIRADMVKSIELYDKKSDATKFTGIDDGERTKTLNVVLNDNSKKGYFGKMEGGESPDLDHYVGQAMFNSFKANSKVSAYGTVGNTNKLGLSGQDASKYGGGGNSLLIDGNVIDISTLLGGSGVITGLPTARNAGLHYDTKWNKAKETLNLNYTTGFNGNKLISNTLRQNNLPTGAINGIEDLNRNNENGNQRFDASYVGNLNPTTMLRISAGGSLSTNNSQEGFISTSTRSNETLLNHSNRTIANDGDSKSFNMNGIFTKRFKKAGRSLSFNMNQSLGKSNSTQYLKVLTDYYNTVGAKDSTGITDQYKPTVSTNYFMNSNVSYSEPLSKVVNMAFSYGLSISTSSSDRESFNKSSSGKYDIHDNIYSNNFDTDVLTNRLSTSLNYNKKKTLINLQLSLGAASQKQKDLITNTEYNRNYVDWQSFNGYTYRFSQQKSLNIGISAYSQQPGISQLQPVKVNTDPLNITVGNPNLKSYLSSGISARYSATKPLTGQSLFLTGSYSLRSNVIVNKTTTDAATGKTTFQYVNLTEKNPSTFQFDITSGNKLKKSDISLTLNLNTTSQHNFNYTNSVLNTNKLSTYNFYTTISKTKVKKYDFNIRFGPGYNLTTNSVQKQNNTNGWVFRDDNSFNFYLPGKVQLSTTANYIFRQKQKTFPGAKDFSMFTLNSGISKKFFKKENLIFSVSGNDLLDQNVSFVRNSSLNNISTQTYNNTLSRYFMVSLVWDFVKPTKGGPAPAPGIGPGMPPGGAPRALPPGAIPRPAPAGTTTPSGGTPSGTPAPRTVPSGTTPAPRPTTTPQN